MLKINPLCNRYSLFILTKLFHSFDPPLFSHGYALYLMKLSKAESFYSKLIDTLLQKNLPFMIGGTYAFSKYTGIKRPTKDLDIICTIQDYPHIIQTLNKAGYITKVIDITWIAKVYGDKFHADIIFAERNGLEKVDNSWLLHAKQGNILGHVVKLVPVEEFVKSKAYIQERDRYDGADVVHLILKHGKTIDWEYLWKKMKPHWQIITSHMLTFWFVYPSEREMVPNWIWNTILQTIYGIDSPGTAH